MDYGPICRELLFRLYVRRGVFAWRLLAWRIKGPGIGVGLELPISLYARL